MENLLPIRTKVFEINNGWGFISEVNENNRPIYMVTFESVSQIRTLQMSEDGKIFRDNDMIPTVSLTEYTLENGGFTPLSDYNKPKVGDFGWFWNDTYFEFTYTRIEDIDMDDSYKFDTKSTGWFQNFSKEMPEKLKEKLNIK
jgi:hypothetical protein